MNRDVIVREVGRRDGLQLVKAVLPTETRLAWISADAAAGVPKIEALRPARAIVEAALANEPKCGMIPNAGLPRGFTQPSKIAAE
jgi:hydroxymethylglutaryl-CoA lyase